MSRRLVLTLVLAIVIISISGCIGEEDPFSAGFSTPEEAAVAQLLYGGPPEAKRTVIQNTIEIRQVEQRGDKAYVLATAQTSDGFDGVYVIKVSLINEKWRPRGSHGSVILKAPNPVKDDTISGRSSSGFSYTVVYGLTAKNVAKVAVEFEDGVVLEDLVENDSFLTTRDTQKTPIVLRAFDSSGKEMYRKNLP